MVSYNPTDLKTALELLQEHKLTPYAGGTDIMTEEHPSGDYLFLNRIPEMKQVSLDSAAGVLRIGAACTFTQLLNHPDCPALLKEALSLIAGPAIRNEGTIGGNIANGSPKADSALICVVADSRLVLANAQGRRELPISEFYLGRKKLALQPDELLVEIIMPIGRLDSYYYHKVGARKSLAISRLGFAGLCALEDVKVAHLATAFGAISDVILRRPEIDALLMGKTIEEAKAAREAYLAAWDEAIVPIRGRVSSEYRKTVCMNLLNDFLDKYGL